MFQMPHAAPPANVNFSLLSHVARGLFAMRRKTVFNNARALFATTAPAADVVAGGGAAAAATHTAGDWLAHCGVNPDARPQVGALSRG